MYRRLRFSMAKGAIPSSKLYDKTLDIFHRAEILILGEDTFGEGEERDDDDDEGAIVFDASFDHNGGDVLITLC